MISVKGCEVKRWLKNLQTDLQMMIWRRGREEKIWWSESGGRRLIGDDSMVCVSLPPPFVCGGSNRGRLIRVKW